MTKDDLNGDKIWGDICCAQCHLVLNTVSVDEEGTYNFVKVAAKGDQRLLLST